MIRENSFSSINIFSYGHVPTFQFIILDDMRELQPTSCYSILKRRKQVTINLDDGGDKWMKICQICGLSVEDTDKQCPNCGSYDLRSDKKEQYVNVDVRLRRFK